MSTTLTIFLHNLSFDSRVLLADTKYTFSSPHLYLLLGKNGTGKSTLLSILSGQFHDFDGQLFLNDTEITDSNFNTYFDNYISFVPQTPLVFEDLDCLKNVLIPYTHKDYERAGRILSELKLDAVMDSKAGQLSMGEKQRLAFARCLYGLKPILLLDEITSNLDEESAAILESKIAEIAKDHLVIFATHEKTSLASSSSILTLQDQKIKEITSTPIAVDSSPVDNVKPLKENSLLRDGFSEIRERKGFHLTTMLMTFFFLFINMFCGIVSTSGDSIRFHNEIYYSNYLNCPSYIVSFENDGSVYDVFDKEDTFICLSSDRIIYSCASSENEITEEDKNNCLQKAGGFVSGLFVANDFEKEFTLTKGRFPEAEDELIISSLSYECMLNYSTEEEIFAKQISIGFSSNTPYNIVGVYQADDPTTFNKRFKHLTTEISFAYNQRVSYAFRLESMFTIQRDLSDQSILSYAVLNRNNNKEKMTKEYLSSDFLYFGLDYNATTINENGKAPFHYVALPAYFLSQAILLYPIIALILLISYYFNTRRQNLLLRVSGMSRKRQLKKNFCALALDGTIAFLGAVIGSILYIVLGNIFYDLTIIESNYYSYLIYSWPSLGIILLTYIGFLLVAFLACYFLYSPKRIDRQLRELKRK